MLGTLNLPISAHLPVTIARPGSATTTCEPSSHSSVYRGRSATAAPAPMFIMADEELPPTLGVLWQVVQVPKTCGWPSTSLNPGTTEIRMGKVLNNISPRATACCAAELLPLAVAQLVYRVKALGSKPVPELIPAEKG